MPPEPLPPWDRKEFFRDRKHERSDALAGGSAARWRDSSHHPSRDLNRWGSSEFRRSVGYGKQGGWHVFQDEPHHGYGSSRSGEKVMEDESFRPFPRGEGRYGRNNNNRENRGSYNSQREWRGHSWETNSGFSNTPLRAHEVNNEPKSREEAPPYSSHSNGGFGNNTVTCDNLRQKEQHDKMSGGSNGFGTGKKGDAEDVTGLSDWKLVTRSGSLSSRGSGLSHLSSSKSIGVGLELSEPKVELEKKNSTPVHSPSGGPHACETSAALDDTSSRKKPRLGWGEGLAKYEKKKVDGPEVASNKDGSVSASGNVESSYPLYSGVVDKSPRMSSFSDCASPATPSSVACSSSPGLEEKSFEKAANMDNVISNLCSSPDPMSQDHSEEGLSFNLEKLDCNSKDNLSAFLSELLQSADRNSTDSNFIRATAMNKVLMLKAEISKNLEVTESEIDQLETELKSLNSSLGCSSPSASSSLPRDDNAKSCNEHGVDTNLIPRPAPLQIIFSGEAVAEKLPVCKGDQEEFFTSSKNVDVDSPGTVTSKFVEPLSLAKVVSSETMSHVTMNSRDILFSNKEVQDSTHGSAVGKIGPAFREDSKLSKGERTATVSDSVVLSTGDETSNAVIFSSNKELATEAHTVFNKLLPRSEYKLNVVSGDNPSSSQSYLSVKERFASRKRFLKFKERVISLKFKAFQHLWKEDMRLISIRKHRAKPQKKYELSLRSMQNGSQKHRSSIRSRFSLPAGSISLVPTTEVINIVSKILLDSKVKVYRDTLKMPALMLDNREKIASRFISNNGLVEDPRAVEKGRAISNPWTPTEKEIFMDKFAVLGKNFKKIASFLEHKTTADCVEFYYKNHKSDSFEKLKKFSKQEKSFSNSNYLMTSGKKWNRERNAASLDILGAASVMAANADSNTRSRQTCSGRMIMGGFSKESRSSWGDDGTVERSGSFGFAGNDRETAAADVLAGICGSFSSEAMSSCITSSADPVESYREWKSQKFDSVIRRPFTPDVIQNADDETCSDESCGEMDSTDWTDGEKSIFIQAVSSYGKDFSKIARCVRTRSRDQCKLFFSKAKKCLGLDLIHPGPGNEKTYVMDDANGNGSGSEDACAVKVGSGVCSAKLGSKMDEDLPLPSTKVNQDESDPAETISPTALSRPERKNEGDFLVAHKKNGEPLARASDDDSSIVNDVDDHSEIMPVNKSESVSVSAATNPKTQVGMSITESESACEGNDTERPKAVSTIGVKPIVDDLSDRPEIKMTGLEEKGNATTSLQSCLTCVGQDSNLAANASSHLTADRSSCSGYSVNGDYHHRVSLELSSKEKSETSFASANSVSVDSGSSLSEKNGSEDKLSSTVDFQESRGSGCHASVLRDESLEQRRSLPLLTNAESSQVVLRACQLQMPIQREVNGDARCRNLSNSDRRIDIPFTSQAYYLQRCTDLKPPCSVTEFPLVSQKMEQAIEQLKAHTHSLSDSENSSRSGGDVKLFGKILSNPSSVQKKANSSPLENEGREGSHVYKLSNKPSNLKFPDGNSGVLKFDPSGYLDLESVRRGYGYWDRSRLPVAFPAIPDSAILLAKYPAAFSNFQTPSSKIDQPPLQTAVKTNTERSINGVTVYPTREISSNGNGLVDYQLYRGGGGGRDPTKVVTPFTVDVKSRQDMFSEMQRLNGIDALAGYQHAPGRGGVGMNVVGRGGIIVGGGGGQCTAGVSDPVAALKLHFAKTEQFGGPTNGGSGLREDEPWRGKG